MRRIISCLLIVAFVYAGNPNGFVSGNTGSAGGVPPDYCWDEADSVLYSCTTTGTPPFGAIVLAILGRPAAVSAAERQDTVSGQDQRGVTRRLCTYKSLIRLPANTAPATGERSNGCKSLVGDQHGDGIGDMAVLDRFLGMQLEFEELPGIRVCGNHTIVFANQEDGLQDILLGLHSERHERQQQDTRRQQPGPLPHAAADLRKELHPGISPYRTTRWHRPWLHYH